MTTAAPPNLTINPVTGQPILPQPAGGSAAGGGSYNWNQGTWAAEVLVKLAQLTGEHSSDNFVTVNNVQNIMRWMVLEEPPNDWYHNNNPLNINAGRSGSDTFSSLDASSTATAQLIYNSYPGILQALRTNAPTPVLSAQIVKSPWAYSHYGVQAAGAPAQYIVSGRGLDYLATVGIPSLISTIAGAATSANTPNPTGITGQIAGSIPGVSALARVGTLLSDVLSGTWWKRIGIGALGAGLVIAGMAVFVSTTKTAGAIKDAAPMAALAAA